MAQPCAALGRRRDTEKGVWKRTEERAEGGEEGRRARRALAYTIAY